MPSRLTRRRFLAASAAVAAAPYVKAFAPGEPKEKVRLAVVGVANRGSANLAGVAAENVVALCDVDPAHAVKARAQFPSAQFFTDYRKMFDAVANKVDAVVVSTPDHTHAHPSLIAMGLGKHLYCEKPLAHSVEEVRLMQQAAKDKKLVTQMGTQIHAGDNYRQVVEKIQAGAIGKVSRVHTWVGTSYAGRGPVKTEPVPAGVHWDLWLGTAPEQPYQPGLHPFSWRGWWNFGGAALADMACHHMDLPTWALGLTAPTTIQAEGPSPDKLGGPEALTVHYHYPAVGDRGPIHLTWYDGSNRPAELSKIPGEWGGGNIFIGDKGMMIADYGRHILLPEADFKDYKAPEPTIPRSIGHYAEWVKACRENKPQATTCNFGYSGPLTEAVLLGVVSHRLGNKKIEWDAAAMKCTNAPEADQFLKREYRKGWEI